MRGLFILTFAYRNHLLQQVSFFANNIKNKHLEIAIGSGSLFDLFLRFKFFKRGAASSVIGIDYAQKMLKDAHKRFQDNKNVEILHMDASKLKFEDESFDSINMANAFHSIPDIKGSLDESFRVLKKGGEFRINVLTTATGIWPFKQLAQRINRFGLKKGILHKVYSLEEIQDLLSLCHFNNVKIQKSGNCYYVIAIK
jgi:ubiquinone/menaquinone biosynthesis C-methylase UbiE